MLFRIPARCVPWPRLRDRDNKTWPRGAWPCHPGLLWIALVASTLPAAEPAKVEPLAGTQPLTWPGDLSMKMVDDLHAFADRQSAASIERRARHWKRDFTSLEAYEKSIEPNRARLAKYLGVPREADDGARVQSYEPFASEAETDKRPASVVTSVRWPTRDGRWGYGFHIRPSGGRTANIAAIVVVDPHLAPVDAQRLEYPQQLAEWGYDVYVTTTVDRGVNLSVVAAEAPNPRFTDISHREFVYRQAFEMGRSLVGYEVSSLLGLVDALAGKQSVMITGFGDGGESALYATALDPRIEHARVFASFGRRQQLWDQPLDRNVWALLDEFGDAELAAMIVGRQFFASPGKGFEYRVPQPDPKLKKCAAPGNLTLPTAEEVAAEMKRARAMVADFAVRPLNEKEAPDGRKLLMHFVDEERGEQKFPRIGWQERAPDTASHVPFKTPLAEAFAERGYLASVAAHFEAQTVRDMIEHTQALVRESEYVRKDFFAKANRTARDPKLWEASLPQYRQHLYDEVLGRFDLPKLPPNARTRKIYDTEKYVGYEVVLDVFDAQGEGAAGVWGVSSRSRS